MLFREVFRCIVRLLIQYRVVLNFMGRKPENQNRVSTHYLFILRLKVYIIRRNAIFTKEWGFLYDTHQSDRLFNCQIANINVIKLPGIHGHFETYPPYEKGRATCISISFKINYVQYLKEGRGGSYLRDGLQVKFYLIKYQRMRFLHPTS